MVTQCKRISDFGHSVNEFTSRFHAPHLLKQMKQNGTALASVRWQRVNERVKKRKH